MTTASRLLARLVAGLLTVGGGALARAVRPVREGATLERAAAPVVTSSAQQDLEALNAPYDGKVHFVRIRYEPGGTGGMFGFGRRGRGGREPMWAHDYPRGERNFMRILQEVTYANLLVDGSNILALDDPRLFQHPIAYIVEVGAWEPTDEEAAALGTYLRKGGFLIVDDFRGYRDLEHLEVQLRRVLPDVQLVQIDATHEIFDSFFRIDPEAVVPPYGAENPTYYGLFEGNDPAARMLAIVNFDNDISEYWEYSDRGYYPIDLSNEAYKLGVNYFIYALTH